MNKNRKTTEAAWEEPSAPKRPRLASGGDKSLSPISQAADTRRAPTNRQGQPNRQLPRTGDVIEISTPSNQFQAGSVSERAHEWSVITDNPWVNQMVKGVKIELTKQCPGTKVSIKHSNTQ